MIIANWKGASGVGVLLTAFSLNILGVLNMKHRFYSVLILLGGILNAYASWLIDFYPFLKLNIIWSLIALNSSLKLSVPRET